MSRLFFLTRHSGWDIMCLVKVFILIHSWNGGDGVEKIVHKSAIPLYAVAVTWLLYALLFPLYKLPHFLLAAAAGAVVGIVARLFCRDTVEEVPEEPKTTGNPELDKMIEDGKKPLPR